MKKIIILSFVLTALIFFGMKVNSSESIRNTSDAPTPTMIEYQVIVHPDWTILHNQCPMWVTITGGHGSGFIGQPQLYQQGTSAYRFTEMGPVSGVRIAHLYNGNNGQQDNVCYAISLSNSKTGTFYNGQKYIFDLRVQMAPALNRITQD